MSQKMDICKWCFVVVVTSRYTEGSGTYSIAVRCNGLSYFSSCHKTLVSCSHYNDVGLQCTTSKYYPPNFVCLSYRKRMGRLKYSMSRHLS